MISNLEKLGQEELQKDGKSYKAKEDYLQFVEKERKELGYLNR